MVMKLIRSFFWKFIWGPLLRTEQAQMNVDQREPKNEAVNNG